MVFINFFKLVTENDQIWRRNCGKQDFTGCKADKYGNGTHEWDIEICVCEDKLCNEKMGEIPTSSTVKTTTSIGKNTSNLKCHIRKGRNYIFQNCFSRCVLKKLLQSI